MNCLLLEIGTEEIPAGYIKPALNALSANLLKKLDNSGIAHGSVKTYGTPNRLSIEIQEVADKQESKTIELVGPPKKVGFDDAGKPTIAAEKFAEKAGIPLKKIHVKETEKGLYLCAVKTDRGLPAKTLLKSMLPEVILSIPFPKTMKWADEAIQFARPIQSVLALFGKSVISFSLGSIKSGRNTFGHRFMNPGRIKIDTSENYLDSLISADVIADMEARKEKVLDEIKSAAREAGGNVSSDDELVDIVTNLVEYPVAVAGKFDTKFLELPQEVLITSMREHQKYFAVVDRENKLMPCFIAVNNTRAKDMSLVTKGHERVLRARLEDARFFYKSDLEVPLESLVEKLKRVLFQAKLGSVYEKTMRVKSLSEFMAEAVDNNSELISHASRAAFLCKSDLVTQVVVEFPKLQGVMGRVYANITGEPEAVATAIEEHYRPTYSGGALPETQTGAIVGMADKMDSICGCFYVNLVPTGASDPYALRRQAIGIVQIMLNQNISFPLKKLIQKSIELYPKNDNIDIEEVSNNVYTFFQNRIARLLPEEGFSKDVVASVVDVSVDNIPDVWNRVRALEKLKKEPNFEPLAIAFKRVVNIIKKADITEIQKGVKTELFQHDSETALYDVCKQIYGKVAELMETGDIDQALIEIAGLRGPVDTFFDAVMVMTDEEDIRNNRIGLLGEIASLFENIADFSKIST